MIRAFKEKDLMAIMQIWFDANMKTHDFIPKEYWADHYKIVRDVLPQAEVYVYEDDVTKKTEGFIGLSDDYIEGLFVRDSARSHGIGKQLLEHVKCLKDKMHLCVYKKNTRAVQFYQREQFVVQSENVEPSTNQEEYVMIWKKKL